MPLSCKNKSDIWVSWIKLLFLTCGGIFAIIQYFHYIDQEKVAKTIIFVQKYNEGEIRSAITDLKEVWFKVDIEIKVQNIESALGEINDSTKPIIADKIRIKADEDFKDLVDSIIKTYDFKTKIIIVANFYEAIAICALNNECDKKLAGNFFKVDMVSFLNNYYPFFKDIEMKWNKDMVKNVKLFVDPNK